MRTYYTPQRLATMQQNLQRYEWARQSRDRILAEANRWAAYDDERLRTLVPPPQVPRAAIVNTDQCPVHGQQVLKVANMYGWKMDFDHPYKVVCPVGGESYPSNDYAAYLKGGLHDKSLLTGEYVDDGWGYLKHPGDKRKYWFVAYYAHWMARNWLHPALENLSQAYLLTGDAKYAHKCALLLWQLARYYPQYAYEKQSSYGLENDPGYVGRLLYHTWETWTVQICALAYDAVAPALGQDTALQQLATSDAARLEEELRERLLRVMAEDIIGGSHRIQGNYGMHQKAALLVALVLADGSGVARDARPARGEGGGPTSAEIVDWVLSNPKPAPTYTDSAFYDMLTNLLHRDGVPFESPSYNCGWMSDLAEIADLLAANGVDLWQEPRFRSVYQAPLDQLVCGRFTTPLGDSNNMFAGPLGVSPAYLQRAFVRMRDPRQAAAMLQTGEHPLHDLFSEPADEALTAAARAYGREAGTESSLLPGLGNLTLQTGTPGHRTALSLFYGYYVGHNHFDLLNTDFYAEGNPLTPDLGYPETADTYDPRRFGFLAHTVVHNTVMVNATRQELGPGQLVAFHPGGFAQFAEVTGDRAYPGVVRDYRRTVLLVDVDGEHAYYVDLFHVTGGHQHDWLVHGTEASFDSDLPLSAPRKEGTLAGPDVPYGVFADSDEFRASTYGLYYYGYKGSAFQWLTNVQEAALRRLDGPAPWVRWTLSRDPQLFPKYPSGVKLRSHLLPDDETVFACDGTPQRRPSFPDKLKWVVRRRVGPGEALASTFATVHEAYRERPLIRSVRRLGTVPAEEAVALEVDLGGRRDVIFASRRPHREYTVDGRWRVRGRGAVVSLVGDRPTQARLFDGSSLRGAGLQLSAPGLRTATIAAVDYSKGLVTLQAACLRAADAGCWVPVGSGSHGACVRIERVLAPDRFALGAQDLRVARGLPLDIEGRTVQTNARCYFVEPGMTLVNERGLPLGRVTGLDGLRLTVQGELKPGQFVDADGDGRGRFAVMAVGPGDSVCLGCVAGR